MPRKDFTAVRELFANDDGLPFGRLLSREYVLSVLADEGHSYRSRVFCPLVTLWGWLSQSLSQDKSLAEAVSRIVAHRVAAGLPACSALTGGYSQARERFPEQTMVRMAKETGRKVHDSAPDSWNWRGRQVFLADGTGFSMADTPENQLAYPQSNARPKGLGFPLVRAVALISLSTGAVVDLAFDKHQGKQTGESSLLRSMMDSLNPGDVLLADKYYPTYFTTCLLKRRGVDLVSVSHALRKCDFKSGEVLGPSDHIATWRKPILQPEWMDQETFDSMPETLRVREFQIDIEGRDGKPTVATIVSTITDPTIPQAELSALYWQRWNVECDIRSLKCSLHMDVLRCKTPSMVRKEIWCHVLANNLLRGTMVETAKRHDILPRQLSMKGTMQAVESFTPAMMSVDGSETLYNAFLATVSAHRVGNRPGRVEPRFKKSRPAWTTYMTIPRSKSHRRLASQAVGFLN